MQSALCTNAYLIKVKSEKSSFYVVNNYNDGNRISVRLSKKSKYGGGTSENDK